MKGHIRKRGNRWNIVVDAGGHPETGRRRQKRYCARTKRLAQVVDDLPPFCRPNSQERAANENIASDTDSLSMPITRDVGVKRGKRRYVL